MNKLKNLEDLRIVLAVVRGGGLSGGARILGRSHATLYRRVEEIERSLGVQLFERNRTGYLPTAACEEVIAVAQRVESEVHDMERAIAGRDTMPSGLVRITTTDSLMAGFLSDVLSRFLLEYPSIKLDVSVSNEVHNLSKRDADVALRPSVAPPDTLVGRNLGRIHQAVYARVDGPGDQPRHAALSEMKWVGPEERMVYRPLATWMESSDANRNCVFRIDSVLAMRNAVAQGIGVGVLPLYLADPDSRLVRVSPVIEELATDLWLLMHPDLRNAARVRALMQFVATEASRILAGFGRH